MEIAKRIRPYFSREAVAGGIASFEAGRVKLVRDCPERIRVLVEDDDSPALAELSGSRDILQASCTCPDFERDYQPCSHLWGAALLADSRGLLGALPRSEPLRIATGLRLSRIDCLDWADLPAELEAEMPPATAGGRPRAGIPPSSSIEAEDPSPEAAPLLRRAAKPRRPAEPVKAPEPIPLELIAILDLEAARAGEIVIEVLAREAERNGPSPEAGWTAPTGETLRHHLSRRDHDMAVFLNLTAGLEIAALARPPGGQLRLALDRENASSVIWHFTDAGRLYLRDRPDQEPQAVQLDPGPWFGQGLRILSAGDGEGWLVRGFLHRGGEEIDLREPLLLTEGGIVLSGRTLASYCETDLDSWFDRLRREGEVRVPRTEIEDFLDLVWNLQYPPKVEWPPELVLEEVHPTAVPRLTIRHALPGGNPRRLRAWLEFSYDGVFLGERWAGRKWIIDLARRRRIARDWKGERAAWDRLDALGFWSSLDRPDPTEPHDLDLLASRLPRAVRALTAEGWHVEAEGKLFRRPGKLHFFVSSEIDWFNLEGEVDFEGIPARIPDILRAIRRREKMILLDDGSMGMLPEEWLERYGLLASLGAAEGDALRFRRSQAAVLDALFRGKEEVRWDEGFQRTREELQGFEGIAPLDPPPGFAGTLRPYQKDGLGWLGFLRRFGLGGCLADDMGLGKTVQVLAHLEALRSAPQAAGGPPPRPSIIVVPRSLLFNWKAEAARFTPHLKVVEHHGPRRAREAAALAGRQVVLTTYGTLRSDIAWLRDLEFDCAVLDESQAVKNAGADIAKAVRLLRARQRLALSGTPIENHLGELWSLMEFLNPGMLGARKAWMRGSAGEHLDEEGRALLAGAIRPVILRRTKGQVARELPERMEQTIHFDLDEEERRIYQQLHEHYRAEILRDHGEEGFRRNLKLLEALLRLRQAACHVGLIDRFRASRPSTKVELLLEQIEEVLEEGHKVLVFSQFTSLLAIVRTQLDRRGVRYEYLDGETSDRQQRVERFQTDPTCPVFLISLKAGGQGLNLTAADYVFLLDPWWNPAVEAQAIDRAHRIGQTRKVIARRLIARQTVEEKVLELQAEKRRLAESVITEDEGFLRELTREDLERLLS